MKKTILIATAVGLISAAATGTATGMAVQSSADTHLRNVRAQDAHRARVARDKVAKEQYDHGYSQGRSDEQDSQAQIEEDLKTSGYHDEDRLAQSIKSGKNKDLKDDDLSLRVDDVSCISENEKHTRFSCLMEFSDDDRVNLVVTVAEDGSSWISRAE